MMTSFSVWIKATMGFYSLSRRTAYCKISWSLEAARLVAIMTISLRNLTGISAAMLPMCLSNFRAIEKIQTWTWRLRDFTRFCGKTSVRLVNRGPGVNNDRHIFVKFTKSHDLIHKDNYGNPRTMVNLEEKQTVPLRFPLSKIFAY